MSWKYTYLDNKEFEEKTYYLDKEFEVKLSNHVIR